MLKSRISAGWYHTPSILAPETRKVPSYGLTPERVPVTRRAVIPPSIGTINLSDWEEGGVRNLMQRTQSWHYEELFSFNALPSNACRNVASGVSLVLGPHKWGKGMKRYSWDIIPVLPKRNAGVEDGMLIVSGENILEYALVVVMFSKWWCRNETMGSGKSCNGRDSM
ncbi:hypothetical protein BD410DRAFT_824761 [Rickenella mellea]|uniref:Uncharacterized protein n=1 Tax=Rickenella mellea TaxID=50990 RepID=A0A4Y7QK21_9AGAM|nr:hypothetical protein BD410DRAFT_824761 [Rickenella mellea]